eukprot:CAMPEP_0180550270 /NCGR_PEP_ID=MMETSP1036_2-20121128/72550_1 /TAXON_ID=632150 /ORGANISM="Azadinium spinosum, Strain 3D9" /LENGTH=31 /DNA_ID= /DNA_START= /DNA_END= /DNA_ORIENTATION=
MTSRCDAVATRAIKATSMPDGSYIGLPTTAL